MPTVIIFAIVCLAVGFIADKCIPQSWWDALYDWFYNL